MVYKLEYRSDAYGEASEQESEKGIEQESYQRAEEEDRRG